MRGFRPTSGSTTVCRWQWFPILHWTLPKTSSQTVEISVTVTNISAFRDCSHRIIHRIRPNFHKIYFFQEREKQEAAKTKTAEKELQSGNENQNECIRWGLRWGCTCWFSTSFIFLWIACEQAFIVRASLLTVEYEALSNVSNQEVLSTLLGQCIAAPEHCCTSALLPAAPHFP